MIDEPMVWVIRFRDEIRVHMATNPPPYYAKSVSERDWYLRNLTRPREEFVVDEVPGPVDRAIEAEQDRWEKAKTELRAETRRKFLEAQQKENP